MSFETLRENYTIKRADMNQLREYQRRQAERLDVMKPRFNLSETRLLTLAQQRSRSSLAFGGKSANLGEVLNARLPGIIVPSGFTIPLRYYDEFIKQNKLDDVIFGLLNDQKFVHDPGAYRREKLVQLRQTIEAAEFDPELRQMVLGKVASEYAGKGLFVRVIVMHHNPVKGEISQRHGLRNTPRILGAFADLGVHLVLCGHDHQEAVHYIEHTKRGTVISTAGTVSNRSRGGRPSSINVIELDDRKIHVATRIWSRDKGDFVTGPERTFAA